MDPIIGNQVTAWCIDISDPAPPSYPYKRTIIELPLDSDVALLFFETAFTASRGTFMLRHTLVQRWLES